MYAQHDGHDNCFSPHEYGAGEITCILLLCLPPSLHKSNFFLCIHETLSLFLCLRPSSISVSLDRWISHCCTTTQVSTSRACTHRYLCLHADIMSPMTPPQMRSWADRSQSYYNHNTVDSRGYSHSPPHTQKPSRSASHDHLLTAFCK